MNNKRPYLDKLDLKINAEKILYYKEKHKGDRCFIIGNGPSLNKMDLSLIKNEITIGMNKIYLNFKKMGFETNYMAAVNPYVIEQSSEQYLSLSMPKFMGHEGLKFLPEREDIIFIMSFLQENVFTTDLQKNIWQGGTVTFCVLQIAYYMGFNEIVLIGVDHRYTAKGKSNELFVSTKEDVNHFHPDYFGKGVAWQLPDLKTSERAYQIAKNAFEKASRKILDATLDGALTVFDKVKYEDLF